MGINLSAVCKTRKFRSIFSKVTLNSFSELDGMRKKENTRKKLSSLMHSAPISFHLQELGNRKAKRIKLNVKTLCDTILRAACP